jgi:hypothetical protein
MKANKQMSAMSEISKVLAIKQQRNLKTNLEAVMAAYQTDALTPDFNYDYPGRLTLPGSDAAALIYLDVLQAPAITSLFRPITGVKHKQQINLATEFGKMFIEGAACKNNTITADGTFIDNVTIDLAGLKFYTEQCPDEFIPTVYEQALKNGWQINDLTGTELQEIIINVLMKSMRQEFFRLLSFADTSSTDTFYSAFDGLWTRIIADFDYVDYITTLGAPSSTTGNRAYDYLTDLVENADPVLQARIYGDQSDLDTSNTGGAKFYVTPNMWQNLYKLQANPSGGSSLALQLSREPGKPERLFCYGVKVVPVFAWQKCIAEDDVLSGINTLALLTVPDFHIAAMDDEGNSIDAFYDRSDDVMKYRSAARLGYNYVDDRMISASWGVIS